MRTVWLALMASGILCAQTSIGVGVKGGLQPTGYFENQNGSPSIQDKGSAFTGGPAVELRILNVFAIEGDAFYRSIKRTASGAITNGEFTQAEHGSAWEVALLAKIRLPQVARFRPFAGAGPALRRVSTAEDWTTRTVAGNVITNLSGTRKYSDWDRGFAITAGIERPVAPARVTIEGRYTRWSLESGGCGTRCAASGQFALLFGIGF